MSNLIVCVVRDSATAQYGAPLCFVARGQAIRWFTDAVNQADKENQYYMHPDDFELFEIGLYETDDAGTQLHPPVSVVRGKDVAIRDLNS
ncbi:MAG: nonstructural protein [Microvirus sp.]|nr:MAG: nonstructural protein [Microvirus sp.]WNK14400.1 MAG: nonstructural protein [Microvirus sp.]